jgi:hypothetical protein
MLTHEDAWLLSVAVLREHGTIKEFIQPADLSAGYRRAGSEAALCDSASSQSIGQLLRHLLPKLQRNLYRRKARKIHLQ